MFTEALAASYYGTPRTTMDIDIITRISGEDSINKLISALKMAGLEVDRRRIDSALRSSFRIVTFKDNKAPFTVDIILSSTDFTKKAGSILGLPTFYQIPEELILAKLWMIKTTVPRERALKDEDDVRAILRAVRKSVSKKQLSEDRPLHFSSACMCWQYSNLVGSRGFEPWIFGSFRQG